VKLTVSAAPDGKRREPGRAACEERVALAAEGVDRTQPGPGGSAFRRADRLRVSVRHVCGRHGSVRSASFYPQLDKQALIVDERWNGGGFIDQIVLERPAAGLLVGMDTNRNRTPTTIPQQILNGSEGFAC